MTRWAVGLGISDPSTNCVDHSRRIRPLATRYTFRFVRRQPAHLPSVTIAREVLAAKGLEHRRSWRALTSCVRRGARTALGTFTHDSRRLVPAVRTMGGEGELVPSG